MSDLKASISGLRKRLQSSSTNLSSGNTTSTVSSAGSGVSNNSGLEDNGIKRSGEFDKYSPLKRAKMELDAASTAQHESSASYLSTNLHLATEILKTSDRAVSVKELQKQLNISDLSKIVDSLVSTNRVKYDKDKQMLEYISMHNIRSASSLLNYLKNQLIFKGISVKELKDGWNGCIPVINDLEKKGKLLVSRAKKDNSPRNVWINYRDLPLNAIDEEFVEAWNRVKLPSASELPVKLSERGIKPTSIDPSTLKKNIASRVQKKQKKPRKGKITNTHMTGILRDYL